MCSLQQYLATKSKVINLLLYCARSGSSISTERNFSEVPVETAINYLNSAAYQQTYGDHFVWKLYRRNYRGAIPPRNTRKTCVRKGEVASGNPCPICRDKYLVLDHRNCDLLVQFISPQNGQVLSASRTGLCQKRQLDLMVAVNRAISLGYLTPVTPFRHYEYSEYNNGSSY